MSPHTQEIAHARTPGGIGNSFTADSRALSKRRMLHGSAIHGLYKFITLNEGAAALRMMNCNNSLRNFSLPKTLAVIGRSSLVKSAPGHRRLKRGVSCPRVIAIAI
jgi:hypothetical protein